MSIILDALKKSETERQQSGSAEFAIVSATPEKPGIPRWLLVVGFLLAINLIVLLGLLLRTDSQSPSGQSPSGQATAIEAAPTQTHGDSFEEQVAKAQKSPPRNLPRNVAEQTEQAPPAPSLQADLISQNPESVAAEDLYPTIQEVRVTNTIALPELHLDIHVYSEIPADRFVFINMAKLREGSQMAEGPVVVEIRPGGVVLRHLGTSFLVPRE